MFHKTKISSNPELKKHNQHLNIDIVLYYQYNFEVAHSSKHKFVWCGHVSNIHLYIWVYTKFTSSTEHIVTHDVDTCLKYTSIKFIIKGMRKIYFLEYFCGSEGFFFLVRKSNGRMFLSFSLALRFLETRRSQYKSSMMFTRGNSFL